MFSLVKKSSSQHVEGVFMHLQCHCGHGSLPVWCYSKLQNMGLVGGNQSVAWQKECISEVVRIVLPDEVMSSLPPKMCEHKLGEHPSKYRERIASFLPTMLWSWTEVSGTSCLIGALACYVCVEPGDASLTQKAQWGKRKSTLLWLQGGMVGLSLSS